jgi:hypothetical protein
MDRREFRAFPLSGLRYRLGTGLRFLVVTCFIVQIVGCMHHATEQTSSPHKPAAAIPSPSEQPSKTKSVESKPRVPREKKPSVAAEKYPDKKPEQPQEPSTDTLVPPPPLRQPTFGGAGG